MTISLSSNAKINIGLHIAGQREDGYHLLKTLFQEISFGDRLTMRVLPTTDITLKITGSAGSALLPDASNLCYRAAKLLQQKTGTRQGAHIELEKNIPVGAGLGGGSSNAATVLKGLNQLWDIRLANGELEEMAVELGADVPFFIRGGLQLGEGVGDILTPLEVDLAYSVLVVMPPIQISTAWAYRQLDERGEQSAAADLGQFIQEQPVPWERFTNDFESIIFPHYPSLVSIKQDLLTAGADYAGLSGSGSAVYGMFAAPRTAERTAAAVTAGQAILARPCGGDET